MDESMRKRVVFIAHWIENWNWALWYLRDAHDHPGRHRRWFTGLWPLYTAASIMCLVGRRGFDVVDTFTFNGRVECETILLRNFAWHFRIPNYRHTIRERLAEAVMYAQERNCVIGLGALTKAEWLTQGGQWLVDRLGLRLKVPIVHGDTLTAAVVFRQALSLIERFGDGPVFVTGATSKIGRAVVLCLAKSHIPMVMFTRSQERFEAIRNEAKGFERFISRATSLEEGRPCALWITGKAKPSGKALRTVISEGTCILNFSVPNPLDSESRKRRTGLKVFDGGLVSYDPSKTDITFTMRLPRGITYACHAATMVHAYKGWTHHEVGPVKLDMIPEVLQGARDLGFSEQILV